MQALNWPEATENEKGVVEKGVLFAPGIIRVEDAAQVDAILAHTAHAHTYTYIHTYMDTSFNQVIGIRTQARTYIHIARSLASGMNHTLVEVHAHMH